MDKWMEVRNYLKEVKSDCLQLEKRGQLTPEAEVSLALVQTIESLLAEEL